MQNFYSSPSFFIILSLLVVPAAILGLTGRRIRNYGLVASAIFLSLLFGHDPKGFAAFLTFLVVAFVATFVMLNEWSSGKKRLLVFRVSLLGVLAPLILYKISAVFDANLLGFLGISYLTFKAAQVIIEIRDGLIDEMKPADYLYFLIFFAPFTSGPIDRSKRFIEDSGRSFDRDEYADLLAKGILLLLAGAVYQMVIASIIYTLYTPAPFSADSSAAYNLLAAAKDAYAYGFYLFFDFAGYSMMAMGASYCFGIKTPRNFNAPFLALDMKDFWNRWHMTLSFWLRDYVFMRVVRFCTKRKVFSSRLTTACFAYMVNMTLMGLWHGLTVDYLVYGLYEGALLALTEVVQKKSKFYKRHKGKAWFKICSWAVTINLIMFGMALFSGQVHIIVGGLING